MLIAQITDIHMRADDGTGNHVAAAVALDKAIDQINALSPAPDIVLVSGDCTEHGLPEQYTAFVEAIQALSMPVYVVPGNHDRREPMRQAFASRGYLPESGPLNYVIERDGIRIIALDSLIEGSSAGELQVETLDFLRTSLEADRATPTLVMLHHPPFITGITPMDPKALQNRDAFLAIVAEHPQIQRVICGHVHRSIFTLAGTVPCQIAPSVFNAVQFELRSDVTRLTMVDEPPGFLLHLWRDGSLVTHHLHIR